MPPGPEIEPSVLWVWRGWHRLHAGDREYVSGGMGPPVPQALPWTKVRAWATEHGFTWGETQMFDRLIQAMDGEFFEWWNAAHPAKPPRGRD